MPFLVNALCGLAILLKVFAWRNSGDITKDAAEMLHRGKAGTQRETGDFHLGFFEHLGRFLQSAGVELLAKELSGGCLYARGDLIKRQLHNIGDILSRAGKLTQSWKPFIWPSYCSGISECTMPHPTVIHCTPPGRNTPPAPVLSAWRIRPAII